MRWVSVEKELPEVRSYNDMTFDCSKCVLVYRPNNQYALARLIRMNHTGRVYWQEDGLDGAVLAGITHWGPLPAPPKG